MNELDYEILRELISDPQVSFSAIAKKLNVSQNTIKKRYQKMVAEKKILRSFITINLAKIGFQGRARFTIKTDQKMLTIESLKKIPNVFLVAETFGDYDVIAFAAVKDYNGLMTISSEIKKLPTIKQTDISLEKVTHFPVSEQFNYLSL